MIGLTAGAVLVADSTYHETLEATELVGLALESLAVLSSACN